MIVPFAPAHIRQMRVKDVELMARPDMAPALDWLASTNNGKTLVSADGKTILGILGIAPVLPGVCEVFIIGSTDQERHPLTFSRAVRKELLELKPKYRRIQAVSKNDDFHARWLGWLGFEREGLLRKFGLDGEDMVMWSLI